MSGTGLEVSPDMTPADVLAHYGVPGMQWGKRKNDRLGRLERVQSGNASTSDKVKTGAFDVALGSGKSQIAAQVRAGQQFKDATESGKGVTSAALKYYGTRTAPQVAALTFNRAPKGEKAETPSFKKADPKAAEISRKEAKAELSKLSAVARETITANNRSTDPAVRKAAADRYEKEVLKTIESPSFKAAYTKASTVGKGEMAAHVMVFGIFSPLTIKATNARVEPGYQFEIDSAHRILRDMRKS